MEFLEKIGDFFNAFSERIVRFITRLFGDANERQVRKIGFVRDKNGNDTVIPGSVLDRINQLEPEFEKLSEGELKQCASKFRGRLADGETLDDLLPEAFAAMRESGRRHLSMRHYDVQMVGGYILHTGKIAEMVTGEGKTLVSTLPAFLNALAGKVHIVTVNDYLAQRDMEWMGPAHMALGLSVGAIQSNMSPQERQTAYACDITYGTNNEFGFDYLRDNMKPTNELQSQGPLDFAIVDEIDNILIDEARTPLIISGPAHDDISKYSKADTVARQLKRDVDFEVKEKEHSCHLTEDGVRRAEELAGVESFYTAGNMEWPHLIDNSLKAHYLYKRDVNYVVEGSEVIIVDEFTGRKMPGRQWSDGLHQAVEAKEGVRIKAENQTLATITLQNFFKLYNKLAGMTGTAMTEASEFWKIYKLDVVSIPTNKPLGRVNYPDVIYRTEPEKWDAVSQEIREIHNQGRPILVGTVSIEKSEMLSNKLKKYGIKHAVLNAKYHEREAEIISQAGRKGAVTIATNMAGRGTDIILGGNPENLAWEELKHTYASRLDIPKAEWDQLTQAISEREGMAAEGREVAQAGGLHVIGTERHEARRIDLQLRGRSGRQGDPGSSRFFLSLEDDLMRIFAGDWVKGILTRLGMQEGEAIESRIVTNRIEAAQKKVEERHFDIRKNLLEYDEVMDDQRKRVYSYRQQILDGANCRDLILSMIEDQVDHWAPQFLDPNYRWDTVAVWAGQEFGIDVDPSGVRDMTMEQLSVYLKDEAVRQGEDLIREEIDTHLPDDAEDSREWNWQALSQWANRQWGLNTNASELKKIGRDQVHRELAQRATAAIDKYDFSGADVFLADDWGRQSLCHWLNQQFTLELRPEQFEDKTFDEARQLILDNVQQLYNEKEVTFPVSVGMTRFLAESSRSHEKHNREVLARWVNDRFEAEVAPDSLKGRPEFVERQLIDVSRRFLVPLDSVEALDRQLDEVYGAPEAGESDNGQPHVDSAALTRLIESLREHLKIDVDAEELAAATRETAWQSILGAYDKRYRPELSQAERSLVLEVLDTSWKDHLYYMDHVRSGIGLVGYAQKDPKVEYKREGRKAFLSMWDRVGQQVTSAIFRMDKESPAFVGSLWEITATTHEDVGSLADEYSEQHPGGEPGSEQKAVEPIRNRQPRVGRNEPCPCGSGKKYKKCCGKAA